MMSTLKVITLCFLLLCIAISLQGCGGCSEDDVKKCSEAYTTSFAGAGADTKKICSSISTLVTCIKDAGCCDDTNGKAAIDSMQSASSVCSDIPKCE